MALRVYGFGGREFRNCHLPPVFCKVETKSSVEESDLEVYVSLGTFERAIVGNKKEGWRG